MFRGLARFRSLHVHTRHTDSFHFIARNTIAGCLHTNNVRLYHRDRILPNSRSRKMNMLSSPALSASHPFIPQPAQTRSIMISKLIEVCREANITSWGDFVMFLMQTTPVTMLRQFYELTHEVTGLPWVPSIILGSICVQSVLSVPILIYQTKWTSARENFSGDMVAISSNVRRYPTREKIAALERERNELTKTYGCQFYKFVAFVTYQITFAILTTTAVRSVLFFSGPDPVNAMLPWGVALGSIDVLVLPLAVLTVSLLSNEIGVWKNTRSEDGLKMTCKRASIPYEPMPFFLVNLKRVACFPMVLIYLVVPSGLALHWFVLGVTTLNAQLLLTHTNTRRALQIPPSYHETDNPYKDFLKYLRHDLSLKKK